MRETFGRARLICCRTKHFHKRGMVPSYYLPIFAVLWISWCFRYKVGKWLLARYTSRVCVLCSVPNLPLARCTGKEEFMKMTHVIRIKTEEALLVFVGYVLGWIEESGRGSESAYIRFTFSCHLEPFPWSTLLATWWCLSIFPREKRIVQERHVLHEKRAQKDDVDNKEVPSLRREEDGQLKRMGNRSASPFSFNKTERNNHRLWSMFRHKRLYWNRFFSVCTYILSSHITLSFDLKGE